MGARVLDAEIGVGYESVRPAGFPVRALHPRCFVGKPILRPVGLHINGLADPAACDVVEIFGYGVAARDRLVGTENTRLHWAEQPGQISLAPDVVVGVDDPAHAALRSASDRTWATMACVEPSPTMSST